MNRSIIVGLLLALAPLGARAQGKPAQNAAYEANYKKAVDLLRDFGVSMCQTLGRWTPQAQEDYRGACRILRTNDFPLNFDTVVDQGLTDCQKKAVHAVSQCDGDWEHTLPNVEAVIFPPARMEPPSIPADPHSPTGPFPSELKEDRDTLLKIYDKMGDFSAALCRDPGRNALDMDFCRLQEAANKLKKKYRGYRVPPPATYLDTKNTDCGWELMPQLIDGVDAHGCGDKNMDALAAWSKSMSAELHQRYYPTPSAPPSRGYGGERRPPREDQIPSGCHRMSGGGVGCPVSP